MKKLALWMMLSAPCALMASGLAHAGCDQATFNQSSAAQSCQLNAISDAVVDSAVSYCNVTASCLTGTTSPRTANNWNTPELNNRQTSSLFIESTRVPQITNRGGSLSSN